MRLTCKQRIPRQPILAESGAGKHPSRASPTDQTTQAIGRRMNWKLKAKIFRGLARIPLGTQIHYLLQKHVTREWPRRHETLDQLLIAAQRISADAKVKFDLETAVFVEIGAGRDLAVATALRLMGVKHIICADVTRLAKPVLVNHAAQYMARKLGKHCPELKTWEDIEQLGISYSAPSQLASLGLADGSVDCFYSVDTLEHIPRQDIETILLEVRRILNPNGLTINLIDYSDHYARDGGVSRFNFLTFSEKEWSLFNSDFQYVNRLRHSEYLELFRKLGFNPLAVEPDVEAPQPAILKNLAPEFHSFAVDDLFTIRSKIVAAPEARPLRICS